MNNPFKKMKVPSRRADEIEQTLSVIEKRIEQKKKRNVYLNGTLIASIAAIFIFLFTTGDQFTLQTAADQKEKIYYVQLDPSLRSLEGVEKWYYLNKKALTQKQLETILPIIERIGESESAPSSYYDRVSLDHSFIIVHSDDSVSYLVTEFESGNNYYVRDKVTQQVTAISIDEYLLISRFNDVITISHQLLLGLCMTLIYLLYLKIVPKISPLIRHDLFNKENVIELIRSYIIMRITTIGSLIIIIWISPALNLFFLIGTLSAVILLRIGREYYNGDYKRSMWEIPISVITYTLILYLLHF